MSILLNQNLGSIFAKDKKTALRDCTSLKQPRRIFFNYLAAGNCLTCSDREILYSFPKVRDATADRLEIEYDAQHSMG